MGFRSLSKGMREILKEAGIEKPTEIQELGIPEILAGKDVLIIGPTGTGKTEAVMLPVMDTISERSLKPISAIYITPLKALNRDLLDRLSWWAMKLNLEVAVRHGDTTSQERKQQREFPPHILITTPETLMGSITAESFREQIKNLKFVIIDEIHEIVQSKRGTSLSLLLERLRKVAGNFQRIGISATVGSERKVAKFLSPSAKIVKSKGSKRKEIRVISGWDIDAERSAEIVARLVESARTSIIFTNTRQTAEVLASRLREIRPGLPIAVHHGSLSKDIRTKAEQDLKNGRIRAIIATSSLELGIDVGSVDLVIQYLSPRQVSKFLQRLGRAGHRFDKVSKAVIVSGGDDLFESAAISELALEGNLEKIDFHEEALDILALHVVGMAVEYGEIDADEVYETVKSSYLYRNLEREKFDEVLLFLDRHKLIFLDRSKIRKSRKGLRYYYSNLSPIPDTKVFKVINITTREFVGTLDEKFVADYGEVGSSFIVGGKAWRIESIEGDRIYVTESPDIRTAVPSWEGELIPVSREVAEKVSDILEGRIPPTVDEEARAEMEKMRKEQGIMPARDRILIERDGEYLIIHSLLGTKGNEALGRCLSEMLVRKEGESVRMRALQYRIVIRTGISPREAKDLILSIKHPASLIEDSLHNSTLLKWRFIHNAIRFGIIDRRADYTKISLAKILSIYRYSPVYDETLREVFVDKIDVEALKDLLRRIRKGEVEIILNEGKATLFGRMAVAYETGEFVRPAAPEKEILKMYRRRLLRTRIQLYCLNCRKYSVPATPADIKGEVECPKCGSRFIGMSFRRRKYLDVWNKFAAGKQLSKEEEKIISTIRRTADMIISYGRKAILALSARGVGPEFAGRILRNLHPTEEELLRDLMEAEKNFVKTRQFWE